MAMAQTLLVYVQAPELVHVASSALAPAHSGTTVVVQVLGTPATKVQGPAASHVDWSKFAPAHASTSVVVQVPTPASVQEAGDAHCVNPEPRLSLIHI